MSVVGYLWAACRVKYALEKSEVSCVNRHVLI